MTEEKDGAPRKPPGEYWTTSRLRLAQWFEENAPALGELYRGSLHILYANPQVPGRVRLISHAVREVRNNLPRAVAGAVTAQRYDTNKKLENLAQSWAFDADGQGGGPTPEPTSRPAEISISWEKYQELNSLLRDFQNSLETRREAARRLFKVLAEEYSSTEAEVEPQVSQWLKVTEWFMERTHATEKVDSDYSWDEFKDKFGLFEETLTSLTSGYFHTEKGIDELLAEANG